MAEALRLQRTGSSHALVLEGVSRSFGALKAIAGIDLTVDAGERRGILGANGAGKTTLFNAITGDFPPTAGRIRFFGEDVTHLPAYERIRRGMRRTYQNSMLFRGLSVLDNLYLAARGITRGRLSFLRPREDAALIELRARDPPIASRGELDFLERLSRVVVLPALDDAILVLVDLDTDDPGAIRSPLLLRHRAAHAAPRRCR